MKTISDSEASTFQKCERAHMFGYGYNLKPTEASLPIRIGTVGHKVLAEYYRGKQEGLPHDECIQRGMLITASYMGNEYGKEIPIVASRFMRFAMLHKTDDFQIVSVEEPYRCPLIPERDFLFIPDLVIQLPNDRYRIVEFKWGHNFWTNDDVYHMAQLPKYIWGMRELGYDIQDGVVSQFRYRPIKDPTDSQLFRESPYSINETRLENIIAIQRNIAERVIKLPPKEIWKEEAQPTVSKINCNGCFFRMPCSQMLDGINPLKTLRAFYEQRERPQLAQ